MKDIRIAHILTIWERELNCRVPASDKPKYRIAVMFSCFDRPQVYPYKNNLNCFICLKFPHTKLVLQNWSNSWGCSVAYFAFSAFGMIGNSDEPNCKMRHEIYGNIKNPNMWKPFGLVTPIYWLLTGKNNPRLLDL